jgi:hypothetical protein
VAFAETLAIALAAALDALAAALEAMPEATLAAALLAAAAALLAALETAFLVLLEQAEVEASVAAVRAHSRTVAGRRELSMTWRLSAGGARGRRGRSFPSERRRAARPPPAALVRSGPSLLHASRPHWRAC